VTVIQELPGGWTALLTWDFLASGAAGLGPSRMEIRPTDPANPPRLGLSSTVLRDVSFGYARREVRRRDPAWQEASDEQEAADDYRRERLLDELAHGITDRYLATLAALYVGMVNAEHKDPHGKLAEWTGKAVSTIKNHLWQARRRDLLVSAHGKKGGQITGKAREVLGISS
jgi:hypothetical protein